MDEGAQSDALSMYSEGQMQALALMHSLGNVVAGALESFRGKGLLFPLVSDGEFSLLLKMVEKGAQVSKSSSSGKGKESAAACIKIAFATHALRLLSLNVQQVCSAPAPSSSSSERDRSKAAGSAAAQKWQGQRGLPPSLNSPMTAHPVPSASAQGQDRRQEAPTYQKCLQRALGLVVRNPAVDPLWSSLGMQAVRFASLSHLAPVASQQFAAVCALLERVETGEATLCEKEVLLAQMTNLKDKAAGADAQ